MAVIRRSKWLNCMALAIAMVGFRCGNDDGSEFPTRSNVSDTTPDVSDDTPPPLVCGDRRISGTEECDGNSPSADTACSRIGNFVAGSFSCNSDCTLDTSECEPPECTTDTDCGDLVCNRGFCVEDCLPDNCAFGTEQSYVYSVLFPHPDEVCCFDYTGGGGPDNVLAALMTSLASMGLDSDNRTQLDRFADDPSAVLLDYHVVPASLADGGDLEFRALLATNDVDSDGVLDASYDGRVAGQGVYRVMWDSFDADGPRFPFNRGSVVGGEVTAGPSVFPLTISFSDQVTVDLLLAEAQIGGPIVREDNGIFTVVNEDEGTHYGALRLGGVVPFERVLDGLNDVVRGCAVCGGFEGVESPLVYGESEDFYDVGCAPGVSSGSCGDDDEPICGNINLICSVGGIIGSFADIDTNGNGVNDALSVGMRIGLSGATLADPAVEP